MGFTPFNLLYGKEAVLPKEVNHQSLWVMKQALAADEEYSKETIEGLIQEGQIGKLKISLKKTLSFLYPLLIL